MSFVNKYFLRNFTYKSISACSYVFNGNSAICHAQYYTCLNNSENIQSNSFKQKKLGVDNKRAMSVLQTVREKNFIVTNKLKNFAGNIPAYLPFFGIKYKQIGTLFFSTLDEVNTDDFFSLLDLHDTFYCRFQIIELHVWMLLYNLPKQGKIDKFIRLGLIEAMWTDSEKRAKMVSNLNKNFKKNFKTLYGEFVFAQLMYDYCFPKSDAALSSAVWCSFFNKENVDPRYIEAVVCYIRYQMNHLNKLNFEELKEKVEDCKIWQPARPLLEEVLKKS